MLLAAYLLLFSLFLAFPETTQLKYPEPVVWSGKPADRWIASGSLAFPGRLEEASKLILDFANYNDWALEGMDGQDPESKDEWFLFRSFEAQGPVRMNLVFDMNRPWPMNAKGSVTEFLVTTNYSSRGLEIRYELLRPPFGLHEGGMIIVVQPDATVQFSLELKLWGLLEIFMDKEDFQDFLERKVRTLTRNLAREIERRSAEGET